MSVSDDGAGGRVIVCSGERLLHHLPPFSFPLPSPIVSSDSESTPPIPPPHSQPPRPPSHEQAQHERLNAIREAALLGCLSLVGAFAGPASLLSSSPHLSFALLVLHPGGALVFDGKREEALRPFLSIGHLSSNICPCPPRSCVGGRRAKVAGSPAHSEALSTWRCVHR